MINIILRREELIERIVPQNFYLKITTNENVIQYCIDMFNSEIKWDGMFNLDQALDRIKNGDKMYVAYYKDEIFGYCWLRPTFNGFFIMNLFCKKPTALRKIWAIDLMYLLLRDYSTGIITAEVNEFNRKIIIYGALILGFKIN